jgi:hypothetical protein
VRQQIEDDLAREALVKTGRDQSIKRSEALSLAPAYGMALLLWALAAGAKQQRDKRE